MDASNGTALNYHTKQRISVRFPSGPQPQDTRIHFRIMKCETGEATERYRVPSIQQGGLPSRHLHCVPLTTPHALEGCRAFGKIQNKISRVFPICMAAITAALAASAAEISLRKEEQSLAICRIELTSRDLWESLKKRFTTCPNPGPSRNLSFEHK